MTSSKATSSFLMLACLACLVAVAAHAQDQRTSTIGMPARILGLILPGSELEVVPIERDAPVVVRMLDTYVHGPDQHRYDLEYYCLDPGEFDLAKQLRRIDGSRTDDLPEIIVTVTSQLGEGQVKPHELLNQRTPRVGGYRMMLLVGGVVWIVGLVALLFFGRKKTASEEAASQRTSLADRLRPLIENAMGGELNDAEHAELERMLLTYWRGKLSLNETSAAEAITTLRNHETAGVLLRQLEEWLHMPADRRRQVDVGKLLEPYRHVKTELATSTATTASSGGGKA